MTNQVEKLVAVISPWEKLGDLVKQGFRAESLPAEKKVMIWRDDLQSAETLTSELKKLRITGAEIRSKKVTDRWQDTD